MKKLLKRLSGKGRLHTADGDRIIPVSYVINVLVEGYEVTTDGNMKAQQPELLTDLLCPDPHTLELADGSRLKVLAGDLGHITGTGQFF